MVMPHEIIAAYRGNQRHNQIGGETDGIDPEVMADIGYETADRTLEILANMGKVASGKVAPDVKSGKVAPDVKTAPAVCGDCGKPFPCHHGNGRRTFGK